MTSSFVLSDASFLSFFAAHDVQLQQIQQKKGAIVSVISLLRVVFCRQF